jgi:WD repeat-containing protein 35
VSSAHFFSAGGDVKRAVDCCVLLNQWDQGVALAERHNFPQIEALLAKYASHLLEKRKTLEAVELYRKANHHTEAAQLLVGMAEESAEKKVHPLRCKKLYVLAALEVERFRKRMLEQQQADSSSTLAGKP